MEFAGRVALVTGASMGIGRRLALDLAARGVTVVGVARGAEALADVQAALDDIAPGNRTYVLDVADVDAVRARIDAIVAEHGRLDILINNAGIEERVGVLEMTLEHVRRTMQVNFEGTVAAVLAAVPHMVARGEGWIVNLISGAARAPQPMQSVYSASKAAVWAFTEAVSYELEPRGVRAKVLSPAFVGDTRMARASIEAGMAMPPKAVRRTLEQVSRALLRKLDAPGTEINLSRLEAIAPAFRALAPRSFRRSVRKASGIPAR